MKGSKLQQLTILAVVMLLSLGSSCQLKVPNDRNISIIIPLDISSQSPVLELMISGKGPYNFIFDTGSSGSVVDSELANELGLEVMGEDPMGTPGSNNVMMSKRVRAPMLTFKGTDISKDETMNMMSIREILPVDGILSPNLFSDYLITLDYPNSKLILDSDELNKTAMDVTPFIQKPRVINLNIHIDGHTVEAHLDSGNPGGFNIPFSLKDQLDFKKEPYEAGVINTPVASFNRWQATLLGDIKVGNIIYKDPVVGLVEGFRFVNFGYQILKDLRTTIDRKNNLIKFEKVTAEIAEKVDPGFQGEQNDFVGWYGGHERKIFLENSEMYLQRGRAPKLKLVSIRDDEYEMVFNRTVNNELPNVRFERDVSKTVIGLTFVFKDGREDFVKKDSIVK